MVLYPNKLPESERVCSGICKINLVAKVAKILDRTKRLATFDIISQY